MLGLLWRKLTVNKALAEAGLVEKMFFETVYRLAFITGVSHSDGGVWYGIYCWFVYSTMIVIIWLELWCACSDDFDLEHIISAVDCSIIQLITCWKLVTVVVNKNLYKKLAKALESPSFDTSTVKRRQLVEYWCKTHERYLSILIYVAMTTMFFWNVFPLIDEVEYNLMIEVRLPFKYDTLLRYIVIYIAFGVIFNVSAGLILMSDVFMQAYLIPLICQYTVLADCFENIFEDCAVDFKGIDRDTLIYNERFIDKYKKRLGSLVEQHIMILNQTKDLKRILSAPLLGQLCSSGVAICLAGCQVILAMSLNPGRCIMTVGHLAYNMYTLYLICRWCEEITSQSQKIGEAAYFSGWEQGMSRVPGIKATILIIMSRANKPTIFDAGGMYNICISSYSDLVKASYSAFNLLLRMSKD